MKTLAKLQAECFTLGLPVRLTDRPSKETYIRALRNHHWRTDYPGQSMPEQIQPMLLADWQDLSIEQADQMEQDDNEWLVQPKMNGVRALLHIERDGIRVTGRTVSEITYRLSEFQANLPHLAIGLDKLVGTILDGELVCPVANPLQATVAILATSPENAEAVQRTQNAWLQFHAFDILRLRGEDVTNRSLADRQEDLIEAIAYAENEHVQIVPSFTAGKPDFHEFTIGSGGEGTVWKRMDMPYEPGRRVKHWIKRKTGVQIEAFVSGFLPGSPDRGNAHLIGAVEFSAQIDGAVRPVAWVSGLTDSERRAMTVLDASGAVTLNPTYLGRRAIVVGQAYTHRSRRIQHARVDRWLGASGCGLTVQPLSSAQAETD